MRKIKFRGKRHYDGKWVYGYPLIFDTEKFKSANIVTFDEAYPNTLAKVTTSVEFNTLGQFTGLKDRNGREIYEGDIITFYVLKTYCINPDCEPHLLGYSERLHKETKVVRFEDGMFGVDGEYSPIEVLAGFGEWGSDEEFMTELKNDPYFDANGYDLDDVVGIEVIGNVFDNPNLIENESNNRDSK